jgi:hypothetical protein
LSEQIVDIENESLRERRLRLVEVHRRGLDICKNVALLAEEYGVSSWGLIEDWKVRGRWLPGLVDLSDVPLLKASLVGEFDAVLRECWEGVERMKAAESWHCYNGAVKNLREAVVSRGEFLQSLGVLPKAAVEYRVDSKSEVLEVKLDESDFDLVNRARKVVNGQIGGKEQPSSLH